jgi:protein-tyrosine phosphatase
MIDTHCHVLPAIDDGPRTLPEALSLASGLVEAGVGTVVCTPHFSRRFPTDHERARATFEVLTNALQRTEMPLRLVLAAEVGSAAAVEANAEELTRRRLGNRHLLVELEPHTAAGIVEVVVARLRELGLLPIFAHPERCRSVRTQPHILDSARAAGALVQVVGPSLTGRWGDETAHAAWHLLETGRVDLLASDAHRARHAGASLTRVLERISKRLGRDELEALTERNPARLFQDIPATP